jgi:hypothetical protein
VRGPPGWVGLAEGGALAGVCAVGGCLRTPGGRLMSYIAIPPRMLLADLLVPASSAVNKGGAGSSSTGATGADLR